MSKILRSIHPVKKNYLKKDKYLKENKYKPNKQTNCCASVWDAVYGSNSPE